jgi:hypothetical protein
VPDKPIFTATEARTEAALQHTCQPRRVYRWGHKPGPNQASYHEMGVGSVNRLLLLGNVKGGGIESDLRGVETASRLMAAG